MFNCISTPSGLSEWFCDDVNIKKDIHIFFWDGSEESARMVSKKDQRQIRQVLVLILVGNRRRRRRRLLRIPGSIRVDELTGENALVITDFADEDEVDDAKDL